MVCYGIAIMTHRTTLALDEGTAARIKSLAKLWKVSQAEVVRRAVSQMGSQPPKADPIVLLEQLESSGAALSAKAATAYLSRVRQDRRAWRGR